MTLLDDPIAVELAPEAEPARRGVGKVVPLLVAVLLLATAGGAGTWAAFNASTSNSSTFATGSLVLSNTKQSSTACFSSGSGGGLTSNANDCEQLFTVSVQKPGDSADGALTLENVGSLDADVLKVHATSGCASTVVGSFSGTTDLCTKLRLSIQEYSDAGWTTPSTCLFGGGTVTACAFDDAGKTVAQFVSLHGDWANGLSMGAMPAGAGGRRYVRVAVKLDAGEGNEVQGRQASFGLTWRIEE